LLSKGKLIQVASLSCKKKRGFWFKKKTPSKVCCFKNPCLKRKSFPNWFPNLLYKILGVWNVFNWSLNLFPRNPRLQKQNDFKRNFDLVCKGFKNPLVKKFSSQKLIRESQTTSPPSVQKVLWKLLFKSPSFKSSITKSWCTNTCWTSSESHQP
jgi:hypothetical protein